MAALILSRNHFLARCAMTLVSPDYIVSILRDGILRKLRARPHSPEVQREVHHLVDSIAGLMYRGFLMSGNAQASLKDILFGLQRYNFSRSDTLGTALKAFLEALALSKTESGALRFYIKSLVLTRPVFALEYFLFHANQSRVLIREDWDYLFPNHKDPRSPSLRFGEYLLAHRLFFTEDGSLSPERLAVILRYGVVGSLPVSKSQIRVPRYGRALVNDVILVDLLVTLLIRIYECSGQHFWEAAECVKLVLSAMPQGITMNTLYARSLSCRFTNLGDPKDRVDLSLRQLEETGRFPEIEAGIGSRVPTMKHLCRIAVRDRLYENWALPGGIYSLEVPKEVKAYLNLSE